MIVIVRKNMVMGAIDMEISKNCRECQMNKGEYTPNEIEKRY